MQSAETQSAETPVAVRTEKYQAVLDQAIRTFAELGFRGTDVQVIADRAEVGKGTVYRYFNSKEDLFWAASYEVGARMHQALFSAVETTQGAAAKLQAAGLAFAEFFEHNPDCLEILVQERAQFRGSVPEQHLQRHQQIIDRFMAILEEGIAADEFRAVDTRKTVMALGNLIYGTVVFDCYVRHSDSSSALCRHAMDIFLDGIRRRKTVG